MAALSTKAVKLLEALKKADVWEEKAIEILFPKPQYVGTMDPNFTAQAKINIQSMYWQWEANLFGIATDRPVNGVTTHFELNEPMSYASVTRDAFIELKKAGLAIAKNAGYNTYRYQYTGK